MKKVFLIGWKDLTLAFRDRAALVLMLVAPFILTIGLGFVTGRFSGNNSGLSNIPILMVNQDGGQLGNELVALYQSKDLANLVKPVLLTDPAQARQQVDSNSATAAIIIPAGFTKSIFSAASGSTVADVQIEVYANPGSPTNVGVIQTILEGFLSQVEVGRTAGLVAATELIQNGLAQPQDAVRIGSQIGLQQGNATQGSQSISVNNVTSSGKTIQFDVLAYLAPGMAFMFLMYTVSYGGRSLLAERALGTLPRLLVSPTSSTQVLGGKVFGIFLTGAAQMLILIIASQLLFQLNWGDMLGVVVLVLAAVLAAVGWGMLVTSLAKTPGQVSAVGTAIMLTFGILSGTFIDLGSMPAWFQLVSKITPNAWGLDGFTTLAMGGALGDILGPVAALLMMGVVLFTAAVLIFNRRGVMQQ
jgi:ABC-2 type transport system permease protein